MKVPDAAHLAALIQPLERAIYHAQVLAQLRNLLETNLRTFDEALHQLQADLERVRQTTLEYQR